MELGGSVRDIDSSDPSKMTFKIEERNALLKNLTLSISVPAIGILDEISGKRIFLNWASKLHHLIVKKARLGVGVEEIETLDSEKMDFSAFLAKSLPLITQCKKIPPSGDFPTVILDPFDVHVEQPWHYSMYDNSGYPLFSLPAGHTLDHTYELDLDPLNYVEVVVVDKATNTSFKADPNDFRHMLCDNGHIKVTAVATVVSLLPVEVESMRETLEDGQEDIVVIEKCPGVGVFSYLSRISCNELLWALNVDHSKVINLTWAVKELRTEKELNIRNVYAVDEFDQMDYSSRVNNSCDAVYRMRCDIAIGDAGCEM